MWYSVSTWRRSLILTHHNSDIQNQCGLRFHFLNVVVDHSSNKIMFKLEFTLPTVYCDTEYEIMNL